MKPNSLFSPLPAIDREELNTRIQKFYDASSDLWEQVWGEHMHHGYYETPDAQIDRRQAQILLIERLLSWGEIESLHPQQILDVGCGIGGSSLELASRYQAQATGITLSPWQAQRGQERAQEQGLADRVQILVADALAMPFADDSFDLVWSLESGEHMADKSLLLRECHRVLKPGGQLLMATWCHRPDPLSQADRRHLQQIYTVYCLPYIISLPEYEAIAQSIGFESIRTADWSPQVAPFWSLVIESAQDLKVALRLLTRGWTTIRAALSLRLMSRGYASGLVRYGLLTARKSQG